MRRSLLRLEEARHDLAGGYPEGSCNRSYYAAYEAAVAALLKLGTDPGRTHGGNRQMFFRDVVRTGMVSAEVSAALGRTESRRHTADYSLDKITSGDAKESINEAEQFVSTIAEVFFPSMELKPMGQSRRECNQST